MWKTCYLGIGELARRGRPRTMFSKTARQLEVRPQKSRARRITLRLLRLSFLVGLPVLLLPALLPRRVFAKRLSGPKTSAASTSALSLLARERQVQDLVDSFRTRLTIPDAVAVS